MGKSNLVEDFGDFKYSSAAYYKLGLEPTFALFDSHKEASESSASDSEGKQCLLEVG